MPTRQIRHFFDTTLLFNLIKMSSYLIDFDFWIGIVYELYINCIQKSMLAREFDFCIEFCRTFDQSILCGKVTYFECWQNNWFSCRLCFKCHLRSYNWRVTLLLFIILSTPAVFMILRCNVKLYPKVDVGMLTRLLYRILSYIRPKYFVLGGKVTYFECWKKNRFSYWLCLKGHLGSYNWLVTLLLSIIHSNCPHDTAVFVLQGSLHRLHSRSIHEAYFARGRDHLVCTSRKSAFHIFSSEEHDESYRWFIVPNSWFVWIFETRPPNV